jgi:hypothetical protein
MEVDTAVKNESLESRLMKTSRQPPRQALKFLYWFCPEKLYEGIEGDLLEQFESDFKTEGLQAARRKFIFNTLKFFRPDILLRNNFSLDHNSRYMFRSYNKIMLRHLMKRKLHSTINVLGLTMGLTFALLMGVYIYEELKVNSGLKDVERLYILESNNPEAENGFPFLVPAPAAKTIKDEYPTLVEDYYRFWDRSVTVSKGDKHSRIQCMIGDSTFLSMFGFPTKYGEGKVFATQRHALIITKK